MRYSSHPSDLATQNPLSLIGDREFINEAVLVEREINLPTGVTQCCLEYKSIPVTISTNVLGPSTRTRIKFNKNADEFISNCTLSSDAGVLVDLDDRVPYTVSLFRIQNSHQPVNPTRSATSAPRIIIMFFSSKTLICQNTYRII